MKQLTARQKDKLIEAAQNAIEFTVEGTGHFPFDMLRYDLCWPASEGDSNTVELTPFGTPGAVRHVHLKGLKTPTAARWRSFGWEVIG